MAEDHRLGRSEFAVDSFDDLASDSFREACEQLLTTSGNQQLGMRVSRFSQRQMRVKFYPRDDGHWTMVVTG